jgi:hypothetical protein
VGFISILFDHLTETGEPAEPPFFSDLNLDQVFAAALSGREDYRVLPFFWMPLRDPEAVTYRQDVFRDLEEESVAGAVAEFTQRMRTVRERLAQAGRLRYRYQQERWFLDAAVGYCDAVKTFTSALTVAFPESRGFTALRAELADYAGSAGFTRLAAEAAQVSGTLGDIRYCVTLKGNRVTVSRYEGEPDYSAEVAATFAKFAQGTARDYRGAFRSPPDMNSVEERILEEAARLFPEAFGPLEEFCDRHSGFMDATVRAFDREIQFYLAYLDYIAPVKAAGLAFCFPRVSAAEKAVGAEDAFDLALAAKLVPGTAKVVTSDFHLSGPERVIVVTGPNHGGKTTFARMLGQVHYLASLGCPVPGRSAALFLPDQIFTHFPREADLTARHGELEEELYRIRDVLDQATGNSLLVLNESFASTALRDARLIGEQVLDRMTGLGLIGVYVTFVDELASRGSAVVSMAASVVPGSPAERTFAIVRKPADGLAYAAAVAAKYGLTYRQLKDHLPTLQGGSA